MGLIKIAVKNFTKIGKPVISDLTNASNRALKKVSKQAVANLSREVSKQMGIRVGDVKRKIKYKVAGDLVTFEIEDSRLNLQKSRILAGKSSKGKKSSQGISFQGEGKKRIKLIGNINGGSKPFLIRGRNSGKKDIPVYRQRGYDRKVTTLKWFSIPHYIKNEMLEALEEYVFDNYKDEVINQLDRLQYIKKKK